MRSDRYKRERETELDLANIPERKKANAFVRFREWVKTWKLWVKIVVPVVLVIILGGGIALASAYNYAKRIVDEMQISATSTDALTENYDLSIKPVDGFINILLLGVDTRNMEQIKGSRSDMIIIASINTETYDVTLTSLYRDTYLKLGETSTYDKITHACVYGGPEMTMKSLNQALDIDLEQFAIVNFRAVAELVDAVGGIEVDVQETEIYQLNKYTAATARNIGKKSYNLVKNAGVQTLEGVQAVSYGRIRKGVGDDYKRTERMRTVIMKVFEKVKKMSFSDIKGLIELMVPQCKTNLSLNDILALGFNATKYNISSGAGFPYQVTSGYLGKASYVFPENLGASVIQLHKEVFGQEDYTLSPEAAAISNQIAARRASAKSGPPKDKKTDKKKDTKKDDKTEEPVIDEPEDNAGDDAGNSDDAEIVEPDTTDNGTSDSGAADPATPEPEVDSGSGDTGTVTPDPETTVITPDSSGETAPNDVPAP